jgi:plastocyanin
MSIMHVYVASGPPSRTRCPRPPADAKELLLRRDGRPDPPHRPVPLNVVGADGHVRAVDALDGPVVRLDGAAEVEVRGGTFSPARLSIPVGARLTWRFFDRTGHIAFFANGPALMGTPILRAGRSYAKTVTVPGRYQLFCWLHPVTMHQEVIVRPR